MSRGQVLFFITAPRIGYDGCIMKCRIYRHTRGAASFEGGLVLCLILLSLFLWHIRSASFSDSTEEQNRLQALVLANNFLAYCEPLHHSLFNRGEDIVIANGQWSKERSALFKHVLTPQIIGALKSWVEKKLVTVKVSAKDVPLSEDGKLGILNLLVFVEWQQDSKRKSLSLPLSIQVAP